MPNSIIVIAVGLLLGGLFTWLLCHYAEVERLSEREKKKWYES